MKTVREAADFVRQLYPEAKPTRLSGPSRDYLASQRATLIDVVIDPSEYDAQILALRG